MSILPISFKQIEHDRWKKAKASIDHFFNENNKMLDHLTYAELDKQLYDHVAVKEFLGMYVDRHQKFRKACSQVQKAINAHIQSWLSSKERY